MIQSSDNIEAISKALVAFHGKIGKIAKDQTNPYFNSKYAGLSSILAAVNPALQACGLSIMQMPADEDELITLLVHESGQFIGSKMKMSLTKRDTLSQGTAITYARRYAVAKMLSLSFDEDDDGNAAMPSQASQNRAGASQTPKATQGTAPATKAVRSNAEQKNGWFDATDKAGRPTDLCRETAALIANNLYTMDDLYKDYKVSRKDRAALEAEVEKARTSGTKVKAEDVDQDLPF